MKYTFLYHLPQRNHKQGKRNLSFKVEATIDKDGYVRCKYPCHRFIDNPEMMYRDIETKVDRMIDGDTILSTVNFNDEPGSKGFDKTILFILIIILSYLKHLP